MKAYKPSVGSVYLSLKPGSQREIMKPSSSTSSPPLAKLTTAEKIFLVLLPFFLLVLICALNFPNEFHLRAMQARLRSSAFAALRPASDTNSSTPPPRPPDFRLLMGILTRPDRYEFRHRLRLLHSLQPPVTAQIHIRFVLCNLTSEDQRMLVGLEIMRYDDIIVLHCWENMNYGKTYAFFSSLPGLFNGSTAGGGSKPPYDFVMKTDDDTFFMFPPLVESLKAQPREDLYWGWDVPPKDGKPLFMAGMGYVLTWDLVEWIASSEMVKNNTIGPEDTLVGEWLRDSGRGKNVHSTRAAHLNYDDTKLVMYDYPYPPWTFVPNTISVHRLKDNKKWAETLSYFNITAGVRPSKLYHLY